MRHIHAELEQRQISHGQHLLVKDGVTIAYRRVVHLAQAGKWILQVDIKNAFNEVTRAAVMASAPQSPEAAPLIRALYGAPSLMYSQHCDAFHVTRGVIQGCPLGSALFAEAIAPAVQAAHADLAAVNGQAVDSVWYADDGHLACASVDDLGRFFGYLQHRLLEVGLTVNIAKCRLLCPLAVIPATPAAMSDIQTSHAIRCLGGPVLSVQHPEAAAAEAAAWDEVVASVTATVGTIGHMPDPQHVVALLATSGAWSRVRFHAVARGGMPEHVARRLEAIEIGILHQALPPSTTPFVESSLQWRRATTAKRDGGLGLRSVVAEAAALGGLATKVIECAMRDEDTKIAKERMLIERNAAMARRLHEIQRELASQPLQAALLNDLAEGKGTGILNVTARPSDGTLIGPTMARFMLAIMIGASFVDPTVRCSACSDRPLLTPQGTHAVSCKHIMYPRHNGARDALYRQLKSALGTDAVTRETTVGTDGEPVAADGGTREVDVGYCIGSEWHLFDVVFTAQVPPQGSLKATGSRMAIHARQLKAKAQTDAGTIGVEPLAFGALGGMDTATRDAIGAIATETNVSFATTVARLQAAAWLPALRSLACTVLGRDKAAEALLADKTNQSRAARPHRRRRKAAAAPITHQSSGMAATSDNTPDRQRPPDTQAVHVQAPVIKALKFAGNAQIPRQQLKTSMLRAPAHRKARQQQDDGATMRRLCHTAAIWAATTPSDIARQDPLCQDAIKWAEATAVETYTNWGDVKKQAADYIAAYCDPSAGIASAYGCSFPAALIDNHMHLHGKRPSSLRQWTEALTALDSPAARSFIRCTFMAMDQPRVLWVASAGQQNVQNPSLQVLGRP